MHFVKRNLDVLRECTERYLQKAREMHERYGDVFKFIVGLGDWYDSTRSIDVESMSQCMHFVNELNKIRPLYMMIGNHDVRGPLHDPMTAPEVHVFHGVAATVISKPVIVNVDGVKYAMLPYCDPGKFASMVSVLGEEIYNCTTIFAHQTLIPMTHSIHCDWPTDMPATVGGHIHTHTFDANVMYVGTAYTVRHGEGDEKYISYGVTLTSDTGFKSWTKSNSKSTPTKLVYYMNRTFVCMEAVEYTVARRSVVINSYEDVTACVDMINEHPRIEYQVRVPNEQLANSIRNRCAHGNFKIVVKIPRKTAPAIQCGDTHVMEPFRVKLAEIACKPQYKEFIENLPAAMRI